jgi:hypothetical protein
MCHALPENKCTFAVEDSLILEQGIYFVDHWYEVAL